MAYLARLQVNDIPSPYAYSPTKDVYSWKTARHPEGQMVMWFETRHKYFEIFEVPKSFSPIFNTEEAASNWNFHHDTEMRT